MIVGVNLCPGQPAEQGSGPVGYHLVGIHVMAGARSRLEGIDHELIRPQVFHYFGRSRNNPLCQVFIQQPQVSIHLGRRAFNCRHRPEKRPSGS